MTAFIQKMETMFAQAKAAPNIKILRIKNEFPEVDKDSAQFEIDETERLSGIKLADYFKEYWFPASEITLCWDYQLDGKEENGGEFRLINLFKALAVNKPKLWNDDMAEEEKELLRKFRPFDDHPYTGDGMLGVFKIEPGVNDPEVWYYKVTGQGYKMDLSYRGYVECVMETRGYFDWQYFFCDIEINRNLSNRLTAMLDILPRLFPDTDYTKYFERFERLKKRRLKNH
jgi:hypothetical protein